MKAMKREPTHPGAIIKEDYKHMAKITSFSEEEIQEFSRQQTQ